MGLDSAQIEKEEIERQTDTLDGDVVASILSSPAARVVRAVKRSGEMGREDEGDRLAAERHRPCWRQGKRPERQPFHHPRRRIRQDIREASSERLADSLAIGTGWTTGEGKESQQNEIHLPGMWTERMGEAGRSFGLLRPAMRKQTNLSCCSPSRATRTRHLLTIKCQKSPSNRDSQN